MMLVPMSASYGCSHGTADSPGGESTGQDDLSRVQPTAARPETETRTIPAHKDYISQSLDFIPIEASPLQSFRNQPVFDAEDDKLPEEVSCPRRRNLDTDAPSKCCVHDWTMNVHVL
jgi:hypothetical protein